MKKDRDTQDVIRRRRKLRRITGALVGVFVLLATGTAFWLLYSALPRPEPEAQPVLATVPPETADPAVSPTQPATQPATEPPTTSPPETTEPAPSAEELAGRFLADMTLEEKIYQLFLVRPEALQPEDAVTAAGVELSQALAAAPVGGIVLFSKNIVDPEQCARLIGDFQAVSSLPLLVGVDEEGGSVSRAASNPAMGMTRFPSMKEVAAAGDPEQVYAACLTIGRELGQLGFNLDFAPVADVDTNPDNPVIGDRAFSSDPNLAADMVSAAVWGFYDAGIVSCLKHFPGHGDTAGDTHEGYVETGKTMSQLEETELLPFRAGINTGAPMVMAGHIACPNVTGDALPASLSPKLIGNLLRTRLKFQGVVVTDAMDMEAITSLYPTGEAAVLALEAGCDLILLPEDLEEAASAVRTAVEEGRLTEARLDESVTRILTLKLNYGILAG